MSNIDFQFLKSDLKIVLLRFFCYLPFFKFERRFLLVKNKCRLEMNRFVPSEKIYKRIGAVERLVQVLFVQDLEKPVSV